MKDLDIWSLKADHSFTDRNRVSFFASLQNITQLSEGGLPGALASGLYTLDKPKIYRATHDFSFSPTFINHFLFGFSQYNNFFDQLPQHKQDWPDETGIERRGNRRLQFLPDRDLYRRPHVFGNDPKNRGNQSNWSYTINDTASKVDRAS